jgi:hypothetical protein
MTVFCNSHGVPLRLTLGDPAFLPLLPRMLPHATLFVEGHSPEAQSFSLLPPNATAGYRCYEGDRLLREDPHCAPIFEEFARALMIHVANFVPDRVFLHAGVVGWRDRALLLPGPSFAGKTTLTSALIKAGATYYSDEYAVIDSGGWIHPYARDLQMRAPGNDTQTSVPAHTFAASSGSIPLRAVMVVFAHYQPGARWNPQPVTHGMAVLEMLRHSIPMQRTPARVLATLAAMLEGAAAWRSARDEASFAAHALLEALDTQYATMSEASPYLEALQS